MDADGRIEHDIRPDELSNDLAGWIVDDLVAPGLLDPAGFEDAFVGVVQDVDPGWTAFYRNTLATLRHSGTPGGTNAGMAPDHDRAAALAVGPHVVELGCCFGFLSLRLAVNNRVTAVDLVPGTARLLGDVSTALGTPVATLAGDTSAVPLADESADTVFAVHLLEHLPRGLDAQVLAEMLRVARLRAVVAVPFEDEPTPAWGHVRTFGFDDLPRWAQRRGCRTASRSTTVAGWWCTRLRDERAPRRPVVNRKNAADGFGKQTKQRYVYPERRDRGRHLCLRLFP